ncbi:MAG: helix-turn-helix transcriptional regulator [Agathobacter sp.]|nr:helix-turn-helix transcriptional regulator [Agathobacter sp.]
MELGKKIASLRKIKKVTQMQLAEYLSVNPQTVSRWEAEGGTPDVFLLPKIASFFGVSLDELFGMTDMEQINNLVYKYSVLRDEKSFEEVMRSMDIAQNSLEEELKTANDNEKEEIQQNIHQLKAWKVHIYIQKSRGALEKAEAELDELRKELKPENPLYLPLKLQKQQFRIQMGEGVAVIKTTKRDWETQKNFETLYCYMAALFDAQRAEDILYLWKQSDVQEFVSEVNEENKGLWQVMFESAVMEQQLEFFETYFSKYKENASETEVFVVEWELVKLYKALGMEKEKNQLKQRLEEKIETISLNGYMKERYLNLVKSI